MMKLIPALAGAALFAGAFSAANADELRLTDAQMDNVTAGTGCGVFCAWVKADALAFANADSFSSYYPVKSDTITVTTTVTDDTYGNYSSSSSSMSGSSSKIY
jgi:hypothetical protein